MLTQQLQERSTPQQAQRYKLFPLTSRDLERLKAKDVVEYSISTTDPYKVKMQHPTEFKLMHKAVQRTEDILHKIQPLQTLNFTDRISVQDMYSDVQNRFYDPIKMAPLSQKVAIGLVHKLQANESKEEKLRKDPIEHKKRT